MSASGTQKSNFEIVKVLVGTRPPQFFKNPYSGYVMENNQAGYKYVIISSVISPRNESLDLLVQIKF
jgi:hypothetical protein